jgi:hypothetical protein
LPVCTPIPTISPALMMAGSSASSVSSVMIGSPNRRGVAWASTYNHLGVITPIPNDT